MVKVTATWDDGSKITTFTNSIQELAEEIQSMLDSDAEITVEIVEEIYNG